MTAALIGTLALVAFICLPLYLWTRHDGRKQARAQHPSNFTDHASQAIDVTRDVDELMDDIEKYLRGRTPGRN